MTRMSSRLKVKRQSKTIFTACVALTRLSCALAHALLSIGNHPLARGGGVFPLSNFYNGSLHAHRVGSSAVRDLQRRIQVSRCPGAITAQCLMLISFYIPGEAHLRWMIWCACVRGGGWVRPWRPGPAFRLLPCMPNAPRNRPHAAMCWWAS